MPHLTIQLEREEADYAPGEPIAGMVTWDLEIPADEIAIGLTWRTSGKGDTEVGLAGEQQLACASQQGSKRFHFPGIHGPYSFKGKLFTLEWRIQVTTGTAGASTQKRLTIAPSREAIRPQPHEHTRTK